VPRLPGRAGRGREAGPRHPGWSPARFLARPGRAAGTGPITFGAAAWPADLVPPGTPAGPAGPLPGAAPGRARRPRAARRNEKSSGGPAGPDAGDIQTSRFRNSGDITL
jgi:hypothetical protein